MWDTIFGLIPEKRQPGALSVLAFFSVTLPIVAAVCALTAWKLNDRLNRSRLAREQASAKAAATRSEGEVRHSLAVTQASLEIAEETLHGTEADLDREKERTRLASQRHITKSQREKFLKVSSLRPKGFVNISAIEGDIESQTYAEQIRDLLNDAGYEVDKKFGYIQVGAESLVGVRVGAYSKESAPSHALPLAASFIDCDIAAFPVINLKVPPRQVEVTIGSNPATADDEARPAAAAVPPEPSVPDLIPPSVVTSVPVATPIPKATPKSSEKVVAPKRTKE